VNESTIGEVGQTWLCIADVSDEHRPPISVAWRHDPHKPFGSPNPQTLHMNVNRT